jgi:hypothetical protein
MLIRLNKGKRKLPSYNKRLPSGQISEDWHIAIEHRAQKFLTKSHHFLHRGSEFKNSKFIFKSEQMENVETLSTVETQANGLVPQLLTVACFLLGFWIFSVYRKRGGMQSQVPISFNSLVRTSLAEGHLERAFVYLEEQECTGFACELEVYNEVLEYCVNSKNPERALRVLGC